MFGLVSLGDRRRNPLVSSYPQPTPLAFRKTLVAVSEHRTSWTKPLKVTKIYGNRQNYVKNNVQLRQAAPASDFSIVGFFPIRVQNIPEVIRTFFFP